MAGKIQELEGDKLEHSYDGCFQPVPVVLTRNSTVLKTLSKLEKGRKCYRMVGGVLVETTVENVAPALSENVGGVRYSNIDQLVSLINIWSDFCHD